MTSTSKFNAIEGSVRRVADRVLQGMRFSVGRTMLHLCWLQYEVVTSECAVAVRSRMCVVLWKGTT
jgi:hypothetical protein